jgi:hypothetical protein
MEFVQQSSQEKMSDLKPSNSIMKAAMHASEKFSALSAQNTFMEHQNAMLMQQNEYLMRQQEQMVLAIQRNQLFAVIGPPPGLGEQPHMLPSGNGKKKFSVLSHSSESSSRSSSPASGSASNHGDHKHCATEAGVGHRRRSLVPSPAPSSNHDTASTTMIIRNLVDHCTKTMLMEFLDSHGFYGGYNLLYLPVCFASQRCFHYAFVNFVSEDVAEKFKARFHGCTDAAMFTADAADISLSECQGLAANIAKYRNSSVMHKSVPVECKPVFLEHGKVVPFPNPTRKIKEDRRIRKGVDQPVATLKIEE